MKALAIDSSTTRISLSAFNGSLRASLILNAELRQSEKLVPAIDYVLSQAELKPAELEFAAVALGPGSFTGLRLGFAALKSLQMAAGCSLYGVPTLKAYQYPFRNFAGTVVPVIDAKKERFYLSVYRNGEQTNADADLSPEEVLKLLDCEERIILAGDDAPLFAEKMLELRPTQPYSLFCGSACVSDQLLFIADEMRQNGEPPLQDYDGPVYIRKSEAEEKADKR